MNIRYRLQIGTGVLLLTALVCCGQDPDGSNQDQGSGYEYILVDEGPELVEDEKDTKLPDIEPPKAVGGLSASAWPILGQNIYHSGRSPYVGAQEPVKSWSSYIAGKVSAPPVIAENGTIYVSAGNSNLYAISPDGTEKWFFKTAGTLENSPTIGADNVIYVGSFDGKLYAVKESG
ncbi:MAG TPA: hypothetical protein EYN06_03300, partial [Myxococcales bacterium]|nr:hypothetical protein [Myxococcales bacterium]HIN85483.1 hypothetical protein [Myxococcales bacterium]